MLAALRDRNLQYAVVISFLWHAFWFFGISVDVSPRILSEKKRPEIYFLGPVLTDEAFNLLMETKQELSRTVYQDLPPPEENLEPDIAPLGRRSPGELVSVPLGAETWAALEGTLKSEPAIPRWTYQDRFDARLVESPFPVRGQLKGRDLFSLPPMPRGAFWHLVEENAPLPKEIEFELEVNREGNVVRADNVLSSGNPEIDTSWLEYLKQWQFMPLKEVLAPNQTGAVKVPIHVYMGKKPVSPKADSEDEEKRWP